MKVGINVFRVPAQSLAEVARRAEELGYESVWISDHLVLPLQFGGSHYPYTDDGMPPMRPDIPLLDPLSALAYMAAVTSRVRLGTSVYILPLRNPIVTARAAVTVDVLSRGRLIFGVGIGWLAEEFATAGEGFRNRARRTEEGVEILKALWTQPEPEFHGRFYDFGPIKFEPKPAQRPHPPIHFGGETEAALRRAAALGDGWYGIGHAPESAAAKVQKLRALREEAGRGNGPFEVTVGAGRSVDLETIQRYAVAGVDRIMVSPWTRSQSVIEGLEQFAREVVLKLPTSG